ncbi:MAG: SURF1 family protein [Actinomycetota bacterium]|nr:SURF1 family protein [Actinomycetota bacterium]
MLNELRRPRYAALSVLMVVVAAVCVGCGSWQIARLATKAGENAELRRNAHAPVTALTQVLPLVGATPAPAANAVKFKRVTATGTFDLAHPSLVRGRTVNSINGFLVVSPLRTAGGTLMVVRGFLLPAPDGSVPTPPPPPVGQLSVIARIEPADTRSDKASQLTGNQVEQINPRDQSARLGTPVFNGYAELLDGQPGVGSLMAIPDPDLSNPAGGAIEPQHLAYIIQWYLFAMLALAAPFAMIRAESRHAVERDIDEADAGVSGVPPGGDQPAQTADQVRAAKLADRYGRVR